MELASDGSGSVGGVEGGYSGNGGGSGGHAAGDLQQMMVAGYGHYVDGRGRDLQLHSFCTSLLLIRLVLKNTKPIIHHKITEQCTKVNFGQKVNKITMSLSSKSN